MGLPKAVGGSAAGNDCSGLVRATSGSCNIADVSTTNNELAHAIAFSPRLQRRAVQNVARRRDTPPYFFVQYRCAQLTMHFMVESRRRSAIGRRLCQAADMRVASTKDSVWASRARFERPSGA